MRASDSSVAVVHHRFGIGVRNLLGCLLVGLVGCATVAQEGTNPVSLPDDGTIRMGVCIGLLNISDGSAPCPGTDVDAKTVVKWLSGRPVSLLMDGQASIENVKQTILQRVSGMGLNDLLTVSVSGHGTQRPDVSGDEEDGMDEGLVMWDGVWWDDDIWAFICTLPPIRLELFTDTCHAEGNWRRLGNLLTFGRGFRPRFVQLELKLDDKRGWGGELIQFAGCREESYSYGAADGGTWTQTLDAKLKDGISRIPPCRPNRHRHFRHTMQTRNSSMDRHLNEDDDNGTGIERPPTLPMEPT
jgi:hypothetical protein